MAPGRGAGDVQTAPVSVYDFPWKDGVPAIGDGRGSRIRALLGGWEVISVCVCGLYWALWVRGWCLDGSEA